MANYGEEAADLAGLGGALVINMGTVTPEGLDNYKKALGAYNAALRPVVFDPVGYVCTVHAPCIPAAPGLATTQRLASANTSHTAPGPRRCAARPSGRSSRRGTST